MAVGPQFRCLVLCMDIVRGDFGLVNPSFWQPKRGELVGQKQSY